MPCEISGAIGGSHCQMIYSKFLAFLITSSYLGAMIRCVCIMVGIVSVNFSILDCSSCCSILPKVSTRLICPSMSVFCGSKDKLFHNGNCSLFVYPHGLYLAKNIFFMVARSSIQLYAVGTISKPFYLECAQIIL